MEHIGLNSNWRSDDTVIVEHNVHFGHRHSFIDMQDAAKPKGKWSAAFLG